MSQERTEYQISEIMRRVKSKDTSPELAFRKALWARGVRYRLHAANLPGKPDIVLPGKRLAIFIDGDYWHGNQWKRRGHASLEAQFVASPKAEYWVHKIDGNMRRDRSSTSALASQGWRVLRFWESDITGRLDECMETVLQAIHDGPKCSVASRMPEQSVAEFFAGIGLVRLGLGKMGWRTRFANDIDPLKYQMYAENFEDSADHFHLGDIHDLAADDVPDVTLATASFPCNDLSLAGGMKGLAGHHSGAFWGFIRILRDMGDRRPPMVLLENVPGWLSSHDGQDFHDSLVALNQLGYRCDAFMINACHFVPQSRLRLFVVGLADHAADRVSETPAFYESELRPKALADFILMNGDVNWSIRNLPNLPVSGLSLADVIEDLPEDDGAWWSEDRAEYLLNQMSDRHAEVARSMISGNECSYGTAFRRVRYGKSMAELRTDGIAGCLRTPRGGSGRQILFKAGRGRYRVRLLTPRECARLQGAPDGFRINVPQNQALFGFGDAVCVPVIEWIADKYLNPVVTQLMHGCLV